MKLLNYLNEVLNNPVKWNIISNRDYEFNAKFEIEDLTYSFESNLYSEDIGKYGNEDIWEVTFYLIGSTKNFNLSFEAGVTSTGNEFKVFATIVDIFKKFIEVKKPNKFIFTAHEISRIKLYDRFAKEISKRFGYELKTKTLGVVKYYIFSKAGK